MKPAGTNPAHRTGLNLNKRMDCTSDRTSGEGGATAPRFPLLLLDFL